MARKTVEEKNQIVINHCVGKAITEVEISHGKVALALNDGSVLLFETCEDLGAAHLLGTLHRTGQLDVDFGDEDD